MKKGGQHNQIKDAALQKIVAEEAGLKIAKVFIFHLNNDYVRKGAIDSEKRLIFADVTNDVAKVEADAWAEIASVIVLLAQHEIDEN